MFPTLAIWEMVKPGLHCVPNPLKPMQCLDIHQEAFQFNLNLTSVHRYTVI